MPKLRPLVRMAVRREVRAELRRKLNSKGAARARELMNVVTDEVIDDAAEMTVTKAPPVGGAILDWIRDNSDLIRRIVELILGLLLKTDENA